MMITKRTLWWCLSVFGAILLVETVVIVLYTQFQRSVRSPAVEASADSHSAPPAVRPAPAATAPVHARNATDVTELPASGMVRVPMNYAEGVPIVGSRYRPGHPYPLLAMPPAGIRNPPPGQQVFYGEIPLTAPPTLFAIVAGAPGEPSTLYLDRNGDGDLTNDNPPLYPGGGRCLNAARMTLDIRRRDGSTYPHQIWLWTSVNDEKARGAGFNFYSTCHRYARIRLPDKAGTVCNIYLPDHENTGRYSSRMLVDWNGNRQAENAEWMDLGKPVRHGNAVFRLDAIAEGGESITLAVNPPGVAAESIPDVSAELDRLPLLGHVAPDFKATDVDGLPFALSDYRGRVVVMDFWASWCGPCRRKMPEVVEFHQRYSQKAVDIIGISLDKTAEQAKSFAREDGATWRQVCDGLSWNSPLVKLYAVHGIPRLFVIDQRGKIIAVDPNAAMLVAAVDAALAQ